MFAEVPFGASVFVVVGDGFATGENGAIMPCWLEEENCDFKLDIHDPLRIRGGVDDCSLGFLSGEAISAASFKSDWRMGRCKCWR